MKLPPHYKANLYNSFAMKLGTGQHVHVRVDPVGHSTVSIGYIELDGPPTVGKKYTIEIELDDGNLYMECRAKDAKENGKGYTITMTSKQPPRSWLNNQA